jgi:tetratricopeptide (TPR) repeat protein
MAHEQVVSLDGIRHERAYRKLLEELELYGLSCTEELERAVLQFMGAAPDPQDLAEEEHYAFLDWFLFNYATRQTGETLLSLYKEKCTDPIQRALLQAWQETHPSFYKVVRSEGHSFFLRDHFTGEELQAEFKDGRPPKQHDTLIGRLLPVGGHYRPGYDFHSIIDFIEPLRPVLESELSRMQRAFPGATWADLFRERWPLVSYIYPIIATATALKTPIELKSVPFGQSTGQTAPPDDTPPAYRAVWAALTDYTVQLRVSFAEVQNVQRLWWDTVAALQPRVARPETWAAGVAYAWHRWIISDNVTQAEVAAMFAISAPTVGTRARDVVTALSLVEQDDRYVDPLDPLVRMSMLTRYLSPDSLEELSDPLLIVAQEDPEAVAGAKRLNLEAADLMERSQFSKARQKCQEALRRCPLYVPARNNLAQSFLLEGKYHEAINAAEPVLVTHPHNLFTLALLAEAYQRTRQVKKARERLDLALAIFKRKLASRPAFTQEAPGDRQRLWDALVTMEQDQELYTLTQGMDLGGFDAYGLTCSAVAADRCGDRTRAQEWLVMALQLNPDWTFPDILRSALAKMDQGIIPAFHLDYQLNTDETMAGAAVIPAAVRALFVHLIWQEDLQKAEQTVLSLSDCRDLWVVGLLQSLLTRPELDDTVKLMAASTLVQRGSLAPGAPVLIHLRGNLESVRISEIPLHGPGSKRTKPKKTDKRF